MSENELCGRLGETDCQCREGCNDPAKMAKLAQSIIDTYPSPMRLTIYALYRGKHRYCDRSRDGRTVETLITISRSRALSLEMKGGGVFHCYEPQLHVHAEERRVIEIALRKALERNEFEVHYQPVVNAQSGTIESFEALLRWTNPELGTVSCRTNSFRLRKMRLIGPIGEWVLRTACKKRPNGPRLFVWRSMCQPNSCTTIVSRRLSSRHWPRPASTQNRLEVEVTESVFMRRHPCRNRAGQDPGHGRSPCARRFWYWLFFAGYLSKTRFSTIKVDRSFVQGAAKNAPESLAIIRAVVALADSLGMTTTAEGVETEEECRMVNRLGCRKIQGYLYGRPMPAVEARACLAPNRSAPSPDRIRRAETLRRVQIRIGFAFEKVQRLGLHGWGQQATWQYRLLGRSSFQASGRHSLFFPIASLFLLFLTIAGFLGQSVHRRRAAQQQ
ncbi:MAG: EAL domain-containing protein [Sphingomonadales bacterium]|nr:EAL domain-containing protein [Sphingomonadales bacterium]